MVVCEVVGWRDLGDNRCVGRFVLVSFHVRVGLNVRLSTLLKDSFSRTQCWIKGQWKIFRNRTRIIRQKSSWCRRYADQREAVMGNVNAGCLSNSSDRMLQSCEISECEIFNKLLMFTGVSSNLKRHHSEFVCLQFTFTAVLARERRGCCLCIQAVLLAALQEAWSRS